MKAIAIILVLLIFAYIASKRYDKSKKKIQEHINNGDIDPGAIYNEYPVSPEATTRQLFREMTIK
jgi:hypothetical protein